jgi:hypothetical protein
MKLNLLPATVSRGRQSKTAVVGAVIIALLGVGAGLALTVTAGNQLTDAHKAYDDSKGPADTAFATSQQADALMADAKVINLMKNVSLGQAMIAHNDAYPTLYNGLKPYIPSFFRVTSMAASPVSDTQTAVTLVGTIDTYQQYADLMLALMQHPKAVSVSRSGYQADEKYVPAITEVDQNGRPRAPGQTPVPDDPLQRLAFFEAQGRPSTGFTGVGNFGVAAPVTRLNMPGESLITVQLLLDENVLTPNPRATLGTGGGGGGFGGPPAAALGGGRPGPSPSPSPSPSAPAGGGKREDLNR